MNLYQPTISGSLTVSGSVVVDGTIVMSSGSISGTASLAENSLLLNGLNSGSFVGTGSYNTFSGSVSSRLVTQENASGSFAAQSASLSTRVTNLEATSSTVSSSFASTSGSLSSRVTIIEGQDATTGSNNFTAPQQISDVSNAISFTSTASLYTDGGLRVTKDSFISGTAYFNNVVVYGTSSIQYITSSQVNIGTNIITVNTDTPAVRFGGLAVYDSGSTLLTGSMLWDSEKNHWIYSNPSGSTYSGGMLISGPRASSLGNEVGTTACALMMGQGGDHITSSGIFSYGNATCFYGTTVISGSGNVCIAGTLCAPKADFTSDATCVAVRLINGTITGGSTTGVTGLYLGDAGSGVAMLRREKYAANQANVTLYSEYGYSIENITACLGYNGVGFFTAGTQRQFIDGNGVTCFSGIVCSATGIVSGDVTLNSSKSLKFASNANSYVAEEYGIRLNLGGTTSQYGTQFYNSSGTKVAMIDATGAACFSGLQICSSADPSFYFYRSTCNVGSGIGRLYWNALDSTSTQRTYAYVQSVIEACSSTALCSRLEFILASNNNIDRVFHINGAGTACFTGAVCANAGLITNTVSISCNSGDDRAMYMSLNCSANYNSGANNTIARSVNSLKFLWYNNCWEIGATRGDDTAIQALVFAKQGNTYLAMNCHGIACFACPVAISATFNASYGKLQVGGIVDSFDNNAVFRVWNAAASFAGGSGTDAWAFAGSNTDYAIYGPNDLYLYSGGQRRLQFTGGGVACFKCQICSPNFITSANSNLSQTSIRLRSSNNNNYLDINSYNTCNIINSNYGTADTPIIIGSYNGYQNNQIFLATNCNVGINNGTPSAKFHSIGSFKYQNSTYNGFAQSFVWQSSFNNPPQLLYQFTSGNNYAQTLVKVTFIQNGVSAGYAGWFVGYALAHRNPTALTTVAYAMTAQHNPNGIAAPTLSWTDCALCITPNRATNYDGYVVYLEWGGNTNNNATPEIPV